MGGKIKEDLNIASKNKSKQEKEKNCIAYWIYMNYRDGMFEQEKEKKLHRLMDLHELPRRNL